MIYMKWGNYIKAIDGFTKALNLSLKIEDDNQWWNAHYYRRLGLVYFYKGDYINASKNYLESFKLNESIENNNKYSIKSLCSYGYAEELLGNHNLAKEKISEFITIQSKLPSNRKKSPKYRDLTIPQLLELKGIETQSIQNINKRLSKLGVFANWCVRQGFLSESPFKDMQLSIKKKKSLGREPFTIKDLKKILARETFLKWTIDFHHKHNLELT